MKLAATVAQPPVRAALATILIGGIQKHFGSVPSITFAGRTMTPAQLTSVLQTLVNLRNDVVAAQTATKAKLATEESQASSIDATMVAFVEFVRGMFAKRQSTREARGVVGKEKRKAIKGTVTGVVIQPVASTPEEPQHPQAEPAPTGMATPRNGGPQG